MTSSPVRGPWVERAFGRGGRTGGPAGPFLTAAGGCTHYPARASRPAQASLPCVCRTWGRSSAGRASRSQCEGQGFDPPRLHQENQRLSRKQPKGRKGRGTRGILNGPAASENAPGQARGTGTPPRRKTARADGNSCRPPGRSLPKRSARKSAIPPASREALIIAAVGCKRWLHPMNRHGGWRKPRLLLKVERL